MGIWNALTAAQGASRPLFERITVSSQAQYQTSYLPCLARLCDDRLFCVFSAIDPQATGDKAVVVGTFSDDCGKTWSTPITIIDSRPELDYDANIIVIGSRIIVTSTTVPSTHGQFISTSRTVAVRSEDDGKTWSAPYEIAMGHRYCCGKINQGIALRDGTALFGYSWDEALERSDKVYRESDQVVRAGVMISRDAGLTWAPGHDVTICARSRETAITGLDEPAIVECSDGSVYMLCRTGLERLYECRSRDAGHSWSAPAPSALVGHNAPAALCRFGGDRQGILVVWCNSPEHRWPLCAAGSFDDAGSWTAPRQLAQVQGYQSAYPGCAQAADGTLIVLWHQYLPDGGFEIHGARFNLQWLLAGQ